MSLRIKLLVLAFISSVALPLAAAEFRSHAPPRPLPEVRRRKLSEGPARYVDATRGKDENAGSLGSPWKTLAQALKRLKPGDTLYLRGGTYYERAALTRSGTAEAPITICGYPGEMAIIDGGQREFFENPAACWEPYKEGAPGEYVSTRTYSEADDRRVPHQFLPSAWEPMWGIEEERPIALGNFGDSLVPLHGYRNAVDLRAENETAVSKADKDKGLYCGPGLWFNRETGRVHIRLAHHKLVGLGERAYRGETDPRKLPLVVSLGFGEEVLRISGIKHVRVFDLVLRGATGSPTLHLYGSEGVELDHLSIYGGFPGLLVNASKNIKLTNSAFRGLAAPWSGRAHMKYRGTASYQIVLQNNQPLNENIEFAWSEFTDDHDFAFLRYAKNLQFHHNFIDNFNDDGIECGPKLRDHTIYIHENRLGACLGTFQQHEIDKDESPADHAANSGVYIYRNVIDSRDGVWYHLPATLDAEGSYLHDNGALCSDHGGPTWPVIRFYQNTVLRASPVFRDNYLFGLGVAGTRNTERDVFNNIFVQMNEVPGVKFVALKDAVRVREGGNLLWGLRDGPDLKVDPFAKFRTTPLFTDSRKYYEPGWTTHDRIGDPKFVSLSADNSKPVDLRLTAESPAIKLGQRIPGEWPDAFHKNQNEYVPADAGAVPFGEKAWGVGVNGRIGLFSGKAIGK